jgi:hypothetical protein
VPIKVIYEDVYTQTSIYKMLGINTEKIISFFLFLSKQKRQHFWIKNRNLLMNWDAAIERLGTTSLEKLRQISTGRKHSPETIEKISKANKGRVFTEETRKRMSDAKKGKVPKCAFEPPSPEVRKKLSEYASTRTGHKNPNSRLTPDQVKSIKKDFEDPELTNKKIAQKYCVSLSTIKRIKYGKTNY